MWLSGLREFQSLQDKAARLTFLWRAKSGDSGSPGLRRGHQAGPARRAGSAAPPAGGIRPCGYPDVPAETEARRRLTSFAIKS